MKKKLFLDNVDGAEIFVRADKYSKNHVYIEWYIRDCERFLQTLPKQYYHIFNSSVLNIIKKWNKLGKIWYLGMPYSYEF